MYAIDFHCINKSTGSINCSVTHILQNIFFCVQQKKINAYSVWNNLRMSK